MAEKSLMKTYAISHNSIEDMDAARAEYEETPGGKRFAKTIENSYEFLITHHHRRGLTAEQLLYLANKHHDSFINGSFDLAAYYYRLGYNNGKKDAQKEQGEK